MLIQAKTFFILFLIFMIKPLGAIFTPTPSYPALKLSKKDGKTVIPICTSFPIEGPNAIVSDLMLAGAKNYMKVLQFFMDEVNSKKHRFILEHKGNNNFIELKGLSAIKSLVKKSPLMYGLVNLELFLSIEPMIKKKKLLLMFPAENEDSLRVPKYPNVIFFRPSIEKELRSLAHYAIKRFNRDKVAILYEASKWGDRVLATLKKILDEYKIKPLAVEAYPQGTVEIERAANNIKDVAPNIVFCLAHPRPAYTFLRTALYKGMHESLFLGTSDLNSIQKILKTDTGLDIIVTSVVPHPEKSTVQMVKEYQKNFESFLSFRAHSPFYLEAYINLELLVACLDRIKGEPNLEQIISTFESFKNMNFKGINIHFNEADRSLSPSLWINPGLGKKWFSVAKEIYG